MTRALAFRVGDRTMVEGRLAKVVEVYGPDDLRAGSVRLAFPARPWLSMSVPASSLEVIGFGETVREPISPLERWLGVRP